MIQRSTHRSTPRSSTRIVPFLILLALAFLATATLSVPRAAAQAPVDCLAPPPRNQDLTLVAAYAASPPAVDEIAFTMETENLMALTYGGDLMQYKPIWYPDYKVCGAGVNLTGDEAVMGRWAESWKSSADGLTWTFGLKKGIKSEAGNGRLKVERELRARIKKAFEKAGIEIPFQQRTVWHRLGDTPAPILTTAAPEAGQGGR